MKAIFTTFLVAFGLVLAQAQCPTGDVTLTSQAQVDAFGVNWPNCTDLPDNLYISGFNLNITNLLGLQNLSSVSGILSISSNYALTNLTGLESLNFVGGYLQIFNDVSLINLTGLENLSSVGGLVIYNNAVLTSLTELENLSSIGLELSIVGNPDLPVCNTWSVCQYLQNYDPDTQTAQIYDNASGCNSIEEVLLGCTNFTTKPAAKMPLQVLPNPTRNTATVFFEGSSRTKIQLLNTLGSVIQQHEVSGSSLTLDVSALPSGVYFVRATSGATMGTAKLVKE